MKVLVATRNPGKFEEVCRFLCADHHELVSALDHPEVPDVIEDGDTFRANAEKKALAFATASGLPALADDSGLEVDALGGAPGVRSARYAGEPSDPVANNRKLIEAMRGRTDRRARFRCALALAQPDGRVEIVEGACEGRIADAPRGAGGLCLKFRA